MKYTFNIVSAYLIINTITVYVYVYNKVPRQDKINCTARKCKKEKKTINNQACDWIVNELLDIFDVR